MEACSPGVGNHSRGERMEDNPDMERKKQKRIFNRLVHGLVTYCNKYYADGMVKEGIKKGPFEPPEYNKGMYALDEIKISYAEAVKAGPIPSSSKEQKNKKNRF